MVQRPGAAEVEAAASVVAPTPIVRAAASALAAVEPGVVIAGAALVHRTVTAQPEVTRPLPIPTRSLCPEVRPSTIPVSINPASERKISCYKIQNVDIFSYCNTRFVCVCA